MRDTLVAIDGHDKNKLNTAFHFGSVELANKMLQENFGLTPDYYVVVNFFGMEDIINALDGVDITLERKELSYLNENIREINELDKDDADRIREAGEQHLNGRQAVAYMRIRKLDGDSQRVERQHAVLEALFTKAMNMSTGQIPDLLGAVVEYVRTDIPLTRMLDIATAVRGMEGSQLQTFRYPEEFKNGRYEGMSVVKPVDTKEELGKLKNFLEQ
jgi:LCP family protein required for cell wall assembly